MIAPILSVKDVDASVAYYQKLGFTTQMVLPGPDGANAFAFIGLSDTAMIGLSRATDNIGAPGVDLMVYVPDSADIDEVYKSVKANGVATETELKTQYWGDRTFAVLDPDGYRITISKTVEQTDMERAAAVMRGEIEPD